MNRFLRVSAAVLTLAFVFAGCSNGASGGGDSGGGNDVVVTPTYTVIFNANGGEGTVEAQAFVYGTVQSLTANAFTRTGYAFTGWNTEADGSGTAYEDEQAVNNLAGTNGAVVMLYAQWKVSVGITVTFPAADTDIAQLSYTASGTSVTFTAQTGCSAYTWYVNGVQKATAQTNAWTLDCTTLSAGHYTVMVVAQKDDISYSAQCEIQIVK